MIRRSKPKPVLGLDISTSSVKLVELRKVGTSYRVTHFAVEPMPAEAVTDKVITKIEAVGEAVARAWKRSGSRLKNAAVAVGGANVIIKTLTIPAGLSMHECEEQVGLAAAQIVPFSMEEVSWDFELIGPAEREDGMQEALLIATRRENVEHRQAVLEIAGLKALVVDCESFALENAYSLLSGQGESEAPDELTAMLDFGATTTTLSVFQGDQIAYTRDQAFGGSQLTTAIMHHYELSYADAGRAKRQGGLPESYETEVLAPFLDHMAQESARSLQFFHAAMSDHQTVNRVVICGGCAAIPGAADAIARQTHLPVEVADPTMGLELTSRARAQGVERDAPALMIACGLALRSFQ
ncbi:MAG: type IV pilus assembly protein PilM [Gammaproteobacteria bacterium]